MIDWLSICQPQACFSCGHFFKVQPNFELFAYFFLHCENPFQKSRLKGQTLIYGTVQSIQSFIQFQDYWGFTQKSVVCSTFCIIKNVCLDTVSRCLKLVCLFVCIKLLGSISKIYSGPKDINHHHHHHEDFIYKYKYLFSFSNPFCYIQLVAAHPLVVSKFGCKLNRRPKYSQKVTLTILLSVLAPF